MFLKYDFPEEYDIEIIDDGNIGGLEDSKILIVDLTEKTSYISFRRNRKSDPIVNISIQSIGEIKSFFQTKGNFKKKEVPAIEFHFEQSLMGEDMQKIVKFYIDKELVNIFTDHLDYLKEAEVNSIYRKQIRSYLNPSLCPECFTNKHRTLTMLCENCDLKIHGNTILHHKSAEYHGGHRAYPSGGTFRKYEHGQLFLNEKSIIFIKNERKEEKRIDIIIPFTSIALGNYGISEEQTGEVLGGGGIGVPVEDTNIMIGGLFKFEGKENRLAIPYIDEYGVMQKPVFGIPSFGGKEIRKWSHELYVRVLETKRKTSAIFSKSGTTRIDSNSSDQHKSKEDLQRILKLRLAKGEITKDEYIDLIKLIE
ncbi:hypothetical protein [Candidatus Nitrosocosmicus arcticus]|uniref:SHOCT domain-containing protein n=1 Tax=Candidatus Nitrosocosmicus arcticus TaxID=2035267 RepID=A0A557SVY4_9ARCH|nr:hypothetical protein [Candidatus Nitrosocosmicus arcticus]TVP40769.1 hypothetical protein NARC_60156 [Candidatus Nitrosocosmicus arcticus]